MTSLSYNDLYEVFKKLDQNRDGVVTLEELQWLLQTMRVSWSVDELERVTGKRSLSFAEFLEFYGSIGKEGESDLLKAFEVFDRNHDGVICVEELQEALSMLGLWEEDGSMDVKSMIRAYDANCDGFLDFQEFKKMMA